MRLPYSEKLIGDPDTGVLHGGVITALLDQTAGMVARPEASEGEGHGHRHPGPAHRLHGPGDARPKISGQQASATSGPRNIAFIRAWAFHETRDDPVATCVAAFMMGTPNTPRPPL